MLTTFIIPTIGRPSLKFTLQSLIKQTNPDWKAVVIGDCLCPSFALEVKDDRIIFVNTLKKFGEVLEYSGSAGELRNIGINIATTAWVSFVDDDDTVANDYVEWLLQESSNIDILIFRMQFLDQKEKLAPLGTILPPPSTIHSFQLQQGKVGISFSARLCSIKKYGIKFEKSGIEDWIFLNNCISNKLKIKISNKIAYYIRPNSEY